MLPRSRTSHKQSPQRFEMGRPRGGNLAKTPARAKDLIPSTWTGDKDKVQFPEFAFQLNNYMLIAHEKATR